MQHVTAFSRPQTVPAPPAVARKPSLCNYAALLLLTGKIDEFRQFVQLKPDQVDAQVRLADPLFVKGNLEEAKMHYVAALRPGPSRAPVYNNLGNLYPKQGQVSQGIVQFSEGLRLNPGDKGAEENFAPRQSH